MELALWSLLVTIRGEDSSEKSPDWSSFKREIEERKGGCKHRQIFWGHFL